MVLELVKSMSDMTTHEQEEVIQLVRARRLLYLVVYQQETSLELNVTKTKLTERLMKQYDQLGKKIVRLDNMLERIETQVQTIASLRNECELVGDLQAEVGELQARNIS